jgi:hypothetical protein
MELLITTLAPGVRFGASAAVIHAERVVEKENISVAAGRQPAIGRIAGKGLSRAKPQSTVG